MEHRVFKASLVDDNCVSDTSVCLWENYYASTPGDLLTHIPKKYQSLADPISKNLIIRFYIAIK